MIESHFALGRDSGLFIPAPLGVGTLQWGNTWVDERIIKGGCISDEVLCNVFNIFVSSGMCKFFDTAEGYGGGTSESRIALARERINSKDDDLIIATKFLPTFWRWSLASFENALRASLRRLNQSCCDVYFLHSPVHPRPIEFWVEAAALCKKKGLLKTLGLSNCNASQVQRAIVAGRKYGVTISCNQVMFNLLDYHSPALQETVHACNDLGVSIIAYSPIGQGLLADGLTEESFASNRPAKMTGIKWNQLQILRSEIQNIAKETSKSMAQVALNWCICKETMPLVGCRSEKQARDTLGCLGWRLSSSQVERLDKVALSRSTLDGSSRRRGLFVTLAGILLLVYRAAIFLKSIF